MRSKKPYVTLLMALSLLLSGFLAACGATATPAAPAQPAAPTPTAPAAIPTAALNSATTAPAVATTAAAVATTASSAATTAPAVATTAATGAKKGGSVTIALTTDGKTMHPYRCVDVYCNAYIARVYATSLTKRDPKTLEVVGNMAKSWTVNKEAKTVTFALKDNMKWSDGKPITSDDFLWTYQQAIKKENQWERYSQYIADPAKPEQNGIIGYEAPNPQTVVVKLNTLTFDIVDGRADVIIPLPRHVWEGKDWLDPTKNPEIDSPSVASGPWKFKSWEKGKTWTVVRNDNSTVWPVPNLDQVTVTVVGDASIGFQKLKTGEADVFLSGFGFNPQDVAEAETLPNVSVVKWNSAFAQWSEMALNFRRPAIKPLAIRQAMSWVIDKKAIADKVQYGLAVPMYADVAPASDKYADALVEKYGYDPAKAKQILKDAGYTVKDGKLIDPSGTAVPKLKYVFSNTDQVSVKISAIAQQEFKELGIELDIVGSDFNTLLKTIQTDPWDFDIAQLGWSAGINPEGFGDVWKTIPNLNFGAWVNDEVNKLYASAQQEFDNNKRKEIMGQIQKIQSRDGPYIYLTASLSFAGINKRIGGYTATPLGVGLDSRAYSYMTDWFIK